MLVSWDFLLSGSCVLLDWDLLLFVPLFNEFYSFEAGDLMDVVTHSQYERVLIMLGSAFFDLVLGNLSGQSSDDGGAWDVVYEQVHASLLVVEGD